MDEELDGKSVKYRNWVKEQMKRVGRLDLMVS